MAHPRSVNRCPCTRGIGTSTMRGVQRLQRNRLHQHLFSRNLDAQGTTPSTLEWWLSVWARWSLLVLRRGAGKRMGHTERRWKNTCGGARGHRDNSISLVAVGVRGASKGKNASAEKHLHCKQNAVSRPGVIKRARKDSRCGNVPQSTCVTGEHLCNTRHCATVVYLHKPPK